MWFVIFISAVTVSTASVPLPRKVVLNADNLEILRLDIMAMEVRVSNNFKEQADRVEAATVMGRNLTRRGRTSARPMLPWPRPWTDKPPGWIS